MSRKRRICVLVTARPSYSRIRSALDAIKEHPDLDIALFESPADAAYDCDAIVITTEWPDFRELEWDRVAKAMHTPVLLDGRNLLDRARMTKAGFRYLTLAG